MVIPSNDASTTNGHNGNQSEDVFFDQAVLQPRKMRLVCVGAGISGIGAAYKYQRQLENVEFVIYEKNPDVTGTWFENRYPGCACDIPAHAYTYSWEGNPEWSRL